MKKTILIIEDNVNHKKQIENLFPTAEFKVEWLSEFGNTKDDLLIQAIDKNLDSLRLVICDLDNKGDAKAGESAISTLRRHLRDKPETMWLADSLPIVVYSIYLDKTGIIDNCAQLQKLTDAEKNLNQTSLNQLKYTSLHLIKIFDVLCETKKPTTNGKIFISHASIDKPIVDSFVTFLKLCFRYNPGNIFYTSLTSTDVPFSDNILDSIKQNLVQANEVFLMISDNYKASEMCMLEMGSAWITRTKLTPILLPGCDFDKLNWGIDKTSAIKIQDSDQLDKLFEYYKTKYPNLTPPITEWNQEKKQFLKNISKTTTSKKSTSKIKSTKSTKNSNL